MPEPGGKWFAKKCPTRDIAIAPDDHGTLWLVRYINHDQECMGSVAITQGVHARANAELFAKLPEILLAIEPFIRTARGIPENWPEQCVLTFDELPSGNRRLNTLKEDEADRSPTIADWRRLRDLADVLSPRKVQS